MANSPQLPFFAHNNTVKAWCFTGRSTTKTLNPSQSLVDAVNFIDGYNLRLDAVSQAGIAATTTDVYTGALRFAFITPMSDTKYKVFVQHITNSLVPYSHCLNSSVYPKTTTGFWVRCGMTISPGLPTSNQVITMTFGPSTFQTNLRVVVL
jgi:hypothetical protein